MVRIVLTLYIRVSSVQIGDRLVAVNGQSVSDQTSAVNLVKASGPQLVLQIARPRAGTAAAEPHSNGR